MKAIKEILEIYKNEIELPEFTYENSETKLVNEAFNQLDELEQSKKVLDAIELALVKNIEVDYNPKSKYKWCVYIVAPGNRTMWVPILEWYEEQKEGKK